MTDYGYVFSKALREKLKGKIYAGVFVRSTDDNTLEITIARNDEKLVFKNVIDGFSNKMLNGYSTDYAAYETLEKYKRFILNRYFVKQEGGTQ